MSALHCNKEENTPAWGTHGGTCVAELESCLDKKQCCSKSSLVVQVGPVDPALGTNGQWLDGPSDVQPSGYSSNLIQLNNAPGGAVYEFGIKFNVPSEFFKGREYEVKMNRRCANDPRFFSNKIVVVKAGSEGTVDRFTVNPEYYNMYGRYKKLLIKVPDGQTSNIRFLAIPTPPFEFEMSYKAYHNIAGDYSGGEESLRWPYKYMIRRLDTAEAAAATVATPWGPSKSDDVQPLRKVPGNGFVYDCWDRSPKSITPCATFPSSAKCGLEPGRCEWDEAEAVCKPQSCDAFRDCSGQGTPANTFMDDKANCECVCDAQWDGHDCSEVRTTPAPTAPPTTAPPATPAPAPSCDHDDNQCMWRDENGVEQSVANIGNGGPAVLGENPGRLCCFIGTRTQAEIDAGMAAHDKEGMEGFCQPGFTAIIDRGIFEDHPNHDSQPAESAPNFFDDPDGLHRGINRNGWLYSPGCILNNGLMAANGMMVKGTRCIPDGCPILSNVPAGSSLISWPGPLASQTASP